MGRLIVKNLGPLKDVDIELNRINLFIGENGSGKSVLAKIITIVYDILNNNLDNNHMKEKFHIFHINFIENNSIIELFTENTLFFKLENKDFFVYKSIEANETNSKLVSFLEELNQFKKQEDENMKEIKLLKEEFSKDKKISEVLKIEQKIKKSLTNIEKEQRKAKHHHKNISRLSSQYIPAERNLISLFNKSLTTLLVAEVPLPKFLLQFSSEFEKAGNELKELKFLNVKYVNGDGLDRHKVYFNDKDYLPLEHSSSGIQSVLPLYLTVKYFANRHRSIIIEELEQNLFPKAQAETIKYIIEQVSDDNSLFMMTHSPYVLSTLNNLIMAYKVAQMSKDTKERVKEFIKEEQWINPNEFSAYYLENGIAKNIVSKRGLISDNEIDNISDDMGDEFDTLMEIYREFKYAK